MTKTLTEVLRSLNAEDHAAIRRAYYQAAEGLRALVESLENAKTAMLAARVVSQKRSA